MFCPIFCFGPHRVSLAAGTAGSEVRRLGAAFFVSACIASIPTSGFADGGSQHLLHAVSTFNGLVSTQDTILIGFTVDSPIHLKRYCLPKLTHSSLELS